MAQEPYDNDAGNEYQFTDEQESGSAAEYNYEEIPQQKGGGHGSKKKLVIIVVIIVVVLIVAYAVFHSHKKQTPTNVSQTPLASFQKPAVPQKQPTAVSTTSQAEQALAREKAGVSTQSAMPVRDNTQNLPNLSSTISQLKKVNEDLANKIEQQQYQAQTNMASMQESLSNVDTKLGSVEKTMGALSASFYHEQQVQRKKENAKILATKAKAAALQHKKQYFVDAVIPGRAWLKGADGSTLTVATGSVVPGYGKVLSIDPYSGEVRTASKELAYGGSAR